MVNSVQCVEVIGQLFPASLSLQQVTELESNTVLHLAVKENSLEVVSHLLTSMASICDSLLQVLQVLLMISDRIGRLFIVQENAHCKLVHAFGLSFV
jgi:hypothetical protein